MSRAIKLSRFASMSSALLAAAAIPALVSAQAIKPAVDVLKKDIDAVIAAPDGGADRQIKVVDVGKLNVGVGVLTQGKKPNDGKAIVGISHAQVTEVYYVLSGSGTLITGTEISDQAALPADSDVVKVAVGPSHRATFMGSSQRRVVSTGDVVVIPAGVLHGWVEIPEQVRYLSIRPDPDRVLPAGYVNPAIK